MQVPASISSCLGMYQIILAFLFKSSGHSFLCSEHSETVKQNKLFLVIQQQLLGAAQKVKLQAHTTGRMTQVAKNGQVTNDTKKQLPGKQININSQQFKVDSFSSKKQKHQERKGVFQTPENKRSSQGFHQKVQFLAYVL